MKELHLNAYAKVNLALDVLGRREDGYHDIETVLHTLALHDAITLREDGESIQVREDGRSIQVKVDSDAVPADGGNLAVRAARLVRDTFKITRGVEIDIRKQIPVAAGLGGGSSDAAATILGLVQMWKLRLDLRELLSLAVQIGSDVPFFLEGGAALARGRGDRLQWLPPMPTTWVVLARPRVPVETAWAYEALDATPATERPDTAGLIEALRGEDLRGVGRRLRNVFEPLITRHHPVVADVKRHVLEGEAYGAALSGTGPTVFGLMANEAAARKVADDLGRLDGVEVLVTRTFAEER